MIDGKRVVAWIPYGRRKTVSILLQYLQRDHDRGLIDELWFYLNTPPGADADRIWARSTERQRDWVRCIRRPADVTIYQKIQMNTMYAYRYMTDEDTIFLRFDDDIVYVHEDTVERLVKHAIISPSLCTFPIIINNAIVSWWLQGDGRIPLTEGKFSEWPEVGMHCMDPIGWRDGGFAVQLHQLLLDKIDTGRVEDLFGHMNFDLPPIQFSVSTFASKGSEYARLDPPGVLPAEEEDWHTKIRPDELEHHNTILADALVSHLTFLTQRRHFAPGTPGGLLLDEYKIRADRLTEKTPINA